MHLKKKIIVFEKEDTAQTILWKLDAVCNHKNTLEWIQEKIIDIKKDLPYEIVLSLDKNNDLMTLKTRDKNVRESPYEVELDDIEKETT
jgi:hypothetical protein